MLFKLYLLGQLIALPFMVGAVGSMFGGSEPGSPVVREVYASPTDSILASDILCDYGDGSDIAAMRDELETLRFIAEAEDIFTEEGVSSMPSLYDCS